MVSRLTTLLAPFALTALLGGCAAPEAGGSAAGASSTSGTSGTGTAYTPMPSGQAPSDCDTDAIQNMLGQAYSDSVGETARQRSGSRVIRLLRPGQVMTMEYDPSRLNIILDHKGAIQALRCG